ISSDLRAKINDFGLARIRPKANASVHTQCGTPNWQEHQLYEAGIHHDIKNILLFLQKLSNDKFYRYNLPVRDRGIRPGLETLRLCPLKLLSLVQDMWRSNPKD
ncbi:20071_t:CDS:2, partial [Racocetra fulgida]